MSSLMLGALLPANIANCCHSRIGLKRRSLRGLFEPGGIQPGCVYYTVIFRLKIMPSGRNSAAFRAGKRNKTGAIAQKSGRKVFKGQHCRQTTRNETQSMLRSDGIRASGEMFSTLMPVFIETSSRSAGRTPRSKELPYTRAKSA